MVSAVMPAARSLGVRNLFIQSSAGPAGFCSAICCMDDASDPLMGGSWGTSRGMSRGISLCISRVSRGGSREA